MTRAIRNAVKSIMPEVVATVTLCAALSEERRPIIAAVEKATGWVRLGSGHFSFVYELPTLPDVVLKIGFVQSYEGEEMKDRFPWYVHHLQKHRSKFHPKVYALHWVSDKLGGIYVCAMERLEKVKGSDRDILPIADDFQNASYSFSHSRKPCPDAAPWVNRFVDGLRYLGRPDIHDENIMKRPNGDLVVTDPITSFTDVYSYQSSFRRAA